MGYLNAIERLQFPGMCFQDAGNGVRNTDFVSSWPSGIHAAASWNRNLSLQRAIGMGGEFRTKGVNVLLGPVVGPLGEYHRSILLPKTADRRAARHADRENSQGERSRAAEIGKASHLTLTSLALLSARL